MNESASKPQPQYVLIEELEESQGPREPTRAHIWGPYLELDDALDDRDHRRKMHHTPEGESHAIFVAEQHLEGQDSNE